MPGLTKLTSALKASKVDVLDRWIYILDIFICNLSPGTFICNTKQQDTFIYTVNWRFYLDLSNQV